MNKTIQISAIFTATILVAGLIAVGFNNDALAAPQPNPVVKPFDCSSSGTFDGIAGTFEQVGNCSHMGKTTFSGTFGAVAPFIDNTSGFDCAVIGSTNSVFEAANGDTITLTVTGTQCFFDANGDPINAGALFCSGAETSTVDGTYTITGGNGKFLDAAGSGTILASANHCTDAFDSLVSGDIEYAASN